MKSRAVRGGDNAWSCPFPLKILGISFFIHFQRNILLTKNILFAICAKTIQLEILPI